MKNVFVVSSLDVKIHLTCGGKEDFTHITSVNQGDLVVIPETREVYCKVTSSQIKPFLSSALQRGWIVTSADQVSDLPLVVRMTKCSPCT